MKQDIKQIVREKCDLCQWIKYETTLPVGLLQPLLIPQQAWIEISIDFIKDLKSQEKEVIMVIINRFTKFGHFIPMSHPYLVAKVAELFVDHIFKLYGYRNP